MNDNIEYGNSIKNKKIVVKKKLILLTKPSKVKTPITQEETIQEKTLEQLPTSEEITDTPVPLWKNKYFKKGRSYLITSESGAGKSLFSIELGKTDKCKNKLYLILDDTSIENLKRYECLINKNTTIINAKAWEKEVKEYIKSLEQQADNKASSSSTIILSSRVF